MDTHQSVHASAAGKPEPAGRRTERAGRSGGYTLGRHSKRASPVPALPALSTGLTMLLGCHCTQGAPCPVPVSGVACEATPSPWTHVQKLSFLTVFPSPHPWGARQPSAAAGKAIESSQAATAAPPAVATSTIVRTL